MPWTRKNRNVIFKVKKKNSQLKYVQMFELESTLLKRG